MGPRLFRRGNWKRAIETRRRNAELQWGHVFSDVEIDRFGIPVPEKGGFNGATSFQTWK